MKICWDNLEKIIINRNGNFKYINTGEVLRIGICKTCGEEFFGRTGSLYCDYSCANSKENNPMYGKKLSNIHKSKLSNSLSGERNPFYGKKHSEKSKRKMSNTKKGMFSGKNNPMYGKRGKDSPMYGRGGNKHYKWKGGIADSKVSLYDTYSSQISFCEDTRRDLENYDLLQVKCTYCGKWYNPSTDEVHRRIIALDGRSSGECRLYCSVECKELCSIYKKVKYSDEETKSNKLSREVQPELRQMVFERDNWSCQRCGSNKRLQCHHFEGILYNPIESADMDACITLCKKCHKEAHRDRGCRYSDLKCE